MAKDNQYTIFLTCLLTGIVISIFSSCGEYDTLEYNKVIKKRVDSLYRTKRDSLIKHADSVCKHNYDLYIKTAYDSILPLRTKEIEKLIKE